MSRYFRAIAPLYDGDRRRWLEDVGASLGVERARAWLLSDPSWHALAVRDKSNVEASHPVRV